MSYKILEQNGIDIENIDGAAFNNFAAGGRDGIMAGVLSECALVVTGNTVGISPGVLMIHGIRVKVTDMETIVMSSMPAQAVRYQIIAQVDLNDNAVSFSMFAQAPKNLIQDDLFKQRSGKYQVEVARFTHQTDGSIGDVQKTADVIWAGGLSGGAILIIGNVTTQTIEAGLAAEVDVDNRYDEEDGKYYTDFKFSIPKGQDAGVYAEIAESGQDKPSSTLAVGGMFLTEV